MSQWGFDHSQIADQYRLPWIWSLRGKSKESYTPVAVCKWWSHTAAELSAITPNKRRDISHIGRIMETELSEQLHGDKRCWRNMILLSEK
jgi:hypothetical protein